MDVIRYIVAGVLLLLFLVVFIWTLLQPIGKFDDEPGYEKRDGFYYPKKKNTKKAVNEFDGIKISKRKLRKKEREEDI